ncbi:TetR/AcrR family transcriptional regulator [Nonomuraea sp. MG754425]|uniref:TetR/AcrR family transcriptional regulator n=1 Tax=Nonomuraea sp. MG754425 TaxID=2570319 RepID=UPI001F2FB2E8|nr:TetR/AcrR family transcriptional regulator [Nonomuraea sp. MG754425]
MISYHFAGKDELLEQVVTQINADTWAVVRAAVDAERTASGKLRAYIRANLGHLSSHRSHVLAVADIVGSHAAADGTPRFDATAAPAAAELLTEILRQGLADGEVTDFDRLVQSATAALEDGLHVWLQPRLVDAGPRETLDHLARAAEAAELLRKEYGEIDLNVGCELSVFSAGVIPGASHERRGAKLASPLHWPLFPWFNRRLNRLLGRATGAQGPESGLSPAVSVPIHCFFIVVSTPWSRLCGSLRETVARRARGERRPRVHASTRPRVHQGGNPWRTHSPPPR